MSKLALVFVLIALLVVGGCGDGEEAAQGHNQQAQLEQQMNQHRAAARRAKMRHEARAAARRHRRQAAARRHRALVRAEAAERQAAEAAEAEAWASEEAAAEEAAAEEEEASECDPNYSGACLDPYSSDYDCEGGSGNGPDYTGTVTVVGEDHYGLDSDSDGTGCESY